MPIIRYQFIKRISRSKKSTKSESFNHSTNGLFNSASIALNQPLVDQYFQLPICSSEPPLFSSTDWKKSPSKRSNLLKLKHINLPVMVPQPAQASEIYLTTQDLKNYSRIWLKTLPSWWVRSVAELWAKAEKNGSQNPEIALGVKSILLSAKVGRARTDPYGQASLENLSPDDKYYVIGIDKDVDTNVVTIWSKEVEVAPGENLVELSSTDIIYQE